jgi:hypothetical protein
MVASISRVDDGESAYAVLRHGAQRLVNGVVGPMVTGLPSSSCEAWTEAGSPPSARHFTTMSRSVVMPWSLSSSPQIGRAPTSRSFSFRARSTRVSVERAHSAPRSWCRVQWSWLLLDPCVRSLWTYPRHWANDSQVEVDQEAFAATTSRTSTRSCLMAQRTAWDRRLTPILR